MSETTNSCGHSGDNLTDGDDEDTIKFLDWGFKVDRLFEVAYRFYKRNESKAFNLSFDTRNQMNALILQARYGDFNSGKSPDIGVLDFVGKRRQYEWTLLKGMSRTEAMSKFICSLDELCPFFKAHAEAVKISSVIDQSDSIERRATNQSDKSAHSFEQSSEAKVQLKAIYSSLCRQTQNQFKNYAEKQYPNDSVRQKYQIKSLQQQYFQQYISQMHPELKDSLNISIDGLNNSDGADGSSSVTSSVPSPPHPDESQTGATPDVKYNSLADEEIAQSSNTGQDTLSPVTNQFQTIELNDVTTSNNDPRLVPLTSKTDSHVNTEPATNSPLGNANLMIETDISCEELNSSEQDPIRDESQRLNGQDRTNSSVIALSKQMETDGINRPLINTNIQHGSLHIQSEVEHVRLYQNTCTPLPIGPFESYPEPKPVQNANQANKISIDQLDLNNRYKLNSVESNKDNLLGVDIKDARTTSDEQEFPLPMSVHSNSLELDVNHSRTNECAYTNHALNKGFEVTEQFTQLPTLPPISSGPSPDVPLNFANHNTLSTSSVAEPQHGESTTASYSLREKDLVQGQQIQCQQDNIRADCSHQPELQGLQGLESDESESRTDEPNMQESPIGPCEPASTWSKKGVSEFKESLSDDKQGGFYEVKEGTVVVIQVPTYPDGRYIYWEFATDDYDIGFGLDFFYETNIFKPLALSIYEEEDEDEDEDYVDDFSAAAPNWSQAQMANHIDPEAANFNTDMQPACADLETTNINRKNLMSSIKSRRLANTITIVPTYRRDSHEEVFVGRHKYPGQGYYLLRFDNTYSLLRSKALYFRICYFI